MQQYAVGDNGTEVTSFFLSDLIGKKVYRKDGKLLGKLLDIVVSLDYKYPEVEGLVVYRPGQRTCISVECIDLTKLASFKKGSLDSEEIIEFQPSERHFFVRDLLYDRQIVDVNGAKVERVNDIRILSWGGKAYITQVDVGFTGLIRRLGFANGIRKVAKSFGRDFLDELIDWKFVQPLPEAYTTPITISLRQEEIRRLHPGELADIIEELDREQRITLVQSLGVEDAADALEEADINVQTSILRDLQVELAADILEEMEPAVAADVMDKLPSEAKESIMAAMEDEERNQIEILIQAKEESAASLMTVDFVSCLETHTVSHALELLKESADEIESITYVYCTDDEQHLTGVLSIRELILSGPEVILAEIMNRRLVILTLDEDWDTVAGQFLKLRFKALPVVDEASRILGIVTFHHSFLELLPYYHRLAA
jgi:CBS domain-containing protein